MSKSKPKLIIIDGNALIHRSFHALPPTLRTRDGLLVNAVYGFTSFLLKSLNEFHPEFVVLTLDKAGPTFRHEAYAEYKATRVKAPDELYAQIPLVKKVAGAFNIPIFELSGFEADDLIGTICAETEKEKKLEKIIITGDLDTLQLINDRTKVYTMSRGLSDSVLYGAPEVKARYNLRPDQIIDYKALRGDPSDNIPGVRGIGEKTASELLVAFNDLNGVYAAVEKNDPKIKPRIIELLRANKTNAYLSKDLATINRNVPLKFSLDDIQYSTFQLENIISLFSELEFKSLLGKVKELRDSIGQERPKNGAPEPETKKPTGSLSESKEKRPVAPLKDLKFQIIGDDKAFGLFLKKLAARKSFALDTEASGLDPLTANIVGLGFSWRDGESHFVPANRDRLERLRPILENSRIKKSGHNLKFDWRLLKNHGIDLKGLEFDTMIASYLLNPSSRQHSLETLAFTEFGLEKALKPELSEAEPSQLAMDFSAGAPDKLGRFACENAALVYRLAALLKTRIKEEKLDNLFNKIEMPLVPVLGEMENNGIKLDVDLIGRLDKEIGRQLKLLEKRIHQAAKTKFNINSTKQLKEILFTTLEIPTDNLRKIKTGFSTAEDELLKMRELHPIIDLLLSYRELNKLQTTYLNALPGLVNAKTGRLHTSFNQTVAATGRLSSADPNLQNIPTRSAEGQKIRSAFVAERGYSLVGFDYSQIELRLAAHMSGDWKMIKAFKDKEDIHRATAAEINEVKLEDVTKKMRSEAKATNFGILYGQGPHGLSQAAGIPYARAIEFIEKYFSAYPGIKKMTDKFIASARQKGYAVTLFGRRRPLPEINSSIAVIRKGAERMAINTPLQGTAADIIKSAMVNAARMIAGREDEIRLLLQIHDELIFEIRKDKIKTYVPRIKAIMQNVLKLKVPITVDENSGDNWGELK